MSSKLIQKFSLFLSAIFFSLILSINHVTANSVPFYWEFINVDIAVQDNGDMLISETQKYTFTDDYNNQRYRYIPLDKVDKITDVAVLENGRVLFSETGIENNQLWIRWSHQLKPPESHTFVLKYRVIGGLQVNNNDAQVYWKAIFAERKAAIKQAKVRVELPEKVASSIKNFQSFGASANVRQVDTTTIEFVTQQAIEPQQELEVQVTFDSRGTDIKAPQWQNGSSEFSSFLIWVAAVICFWIWSFWICKLLTENSSGSGSNSGRDASKFRRSGGGSGGGDSGSSWGDGGGGGGDGGGGGGDGGGGGGDGGGGGGGD
ncbi:DUF2207 domain-containing protein [Nostoc sp. UHCC 0702]|nr:DUF2207 domain-containing protein [Nostoc sp. UHCC 0702]